MRPTLPLKLKAEDRCKGKYISDIHRKLASIREQLKARLSDDGYQYLCGKSATIFDEKMRDALIAFQRTFEVKGSEGEGVCDIETWERLNKEAGSVYSEVWQYELDALRERGVLATAGLYPKQESVQRETEDMRAAREDAKLEAAHDPAKNADPKQVEIIKIAKTDKELKVQPADEDDVIQAAHAAQLAGLAFSGGGIRSATFNLGMLQALAERKILGDFDYLSTVSGGGYIGGWFSKWLNREHGHLERIADRLSPGTRDKPVRQEPAEIRFLRQYSNYLTPRTGLFSADTWALLATYFRNTALNLTILVALLGAVLIVPRLLGFVVAKYGTSHAEFFAWTGAAAALWAVFFIALSISTLPDQVKHQWRRGQTQGSILALVVLPLLLSAFASSVAVWHYRDQFANIWHLIPPNAAHPVLTWVAAPGIAYFVAWALGWGLAQWHNRDEEQADLIWSQAIREGLGHFACALIALGVGALMLSWSVSKFAQWDLARQTLEGKAQGMLLVSYGMAFMLSIFGIAMILSVGLVGRMYNDRSREWWSRQGGWTAICTLAWLGLSAVSLYAPPILGYAYANLGAWAQALIGSAWLGSTLTGLKLGHSSATGKRGSRPYLEWIAALAPLVFSVGALVLVSTLVYFMMLPSVTATGWGGAAYKGWNAAFINYFESAAEINKVKAGIVCLCLLGVGLAIARRVDVNKFSLYMMYRNRLVRAYLGASNSERNPNPFTGFDENDDEHLDDLLGTSGVIQRPYHIVNAALNMVNGKELAWQTRKAAGFSFTPAFCGFELPNLSSASHAQVVHEAERGCFRPTAGYRARKGARGGDEEAGIKLGMAMAVSGAAVSPNMGYHSSPPLSFLMTLFNVRLGRWFANPRRQQWQRPAPRFGIRYLLAELFGMSDADSDFVYLSDGGHFENLGIYELVRRRCRLIVVIDASADGQLDFEDLGNAIRKCATDLHVEIDIDARQIVPQLPDEFSKAHCVVGDILYDRTDPQGKNGTLLYIKPSLIATEFAEVLNYRKANRDFPHQSTADQWFDETQFESYRSLGYRIGMTVFRPPEQSGGGDPWPVHSIPELAEAVRMAWGNKEGPGSPAIAVPVTPAPTGEPQEDPH